MDSDDDFADFQIVSSRKRKSSSDNSNETSFTQKLGTDERCAEMNTVLIDILPDDYEYKIISFETLKKSAVAGEHQFKLECRINVTTIDGWKEWFGKFCNKSGTSYSQARGDKKGTQKITVSGHRKCIHNVKKRKKEDSSTATLSGQSATGPGRKKGQPRVPGKQTCCPAELFFQLAGEKLNQSKWSSAAKKNDATKYPLLLKITYQHNHTINSADALRYRPISEEVKSKLNQLFTEGHSPSSAYQAFKTQLSEEYGEQFITVSADRSIMPDYFFVYHFHDEYIKKNYGSINGIDSYQRAVDKIKEYNTKNGDILAKIGQTDDGETCVAICDKFNRRCLDNLPHAGDLILVDATSNLDRQDTKVFHVMTPSAIGALPLGTVISSREDECTLKFGFDLYKSLLDDNSFYGRGGMKGPKIALTDDSTAEQNTLRYAWPEMILLLCLFHVLQAVWGWLWKASHNVAQFDRPILYNAFKSMVYAKDEDEYSEALESFKSNETVAKYDNYTEHVEKSYLCRKSEWALSDRISNKLETHGTNTTNYVETSFRLTKENQFHRIRAYNLPDLLGIILDDSEYYVQRCIDVGNNRISKLVNQKSKYLYKKVNIDVSQVENLGEFIYRVPSENDVNESYVVDMNLGLCECPVGSSKGPCKHKNIVAKHFKIPTFHSLPTESPEMRAFYHFLGTGERQNLTWYRPLQSDDNLHAHGSANIMTNRDITTTETEELDNNVGIVQAVQDDDDDNGDDVVINDVVAEFETSISTLLEVVKDRCSHDPENYVKALRAFNIQNKTLLKGNDSMIQKALHTFGKESTKALVRGKRKNAGTIPIQSKSKSRRKFPMRGRGSSIKGRRTKDLPQSSIKQGDLVWYTLPKQKARKKKKKVHSMAKVVKLNVASDKKH